MSHSKEVHNSSFFVQVLIVAINNESKGMFCGMISSTLIFFSNFISEEHF